MGDIEKTKQENETMKQVIKEIKELVNMTEEERTEFTQNEENDFVDFYPCAIGYIGARVNSLKLD